MSEPKKRIRRSPEDARALILGAAGQRLKSDGPEGLQLAEIAAVAGVAHSTVLHHFGSAERLRTSLAEAMVENLLSDILKVLDETGGVASEDHTVLFRVFEVLSDDGHARLLAWGMLKGLDLDDGQGTLANLFAQLTAALVIAVKMAVATKDPDAPPLSDEAANKRARFIIYLVALTAVGDGISGPPLASLIGLSVTEAKGEFRDWFADLLQLK
jgi:AcrR family transcriptional regulator